jgi:hypothetical protein
MLRIAAIVGTLVLLPGTALAQPVEPQPKPRPNPDDGNPVLDPFPKPAPAPAPAEPEPAADPNANLREALDELRSDNEDLRDELELLEEDLAYTDAQVKELLPVKARLSGYLDVGFFHVGGDGSGLRSDIGNTRFPEYADVVPGSWVFMGDPLSTVINGRGDPADTGESRAILFNPIDAGSRPTFLVNALNLQLFTGIGADASLHASVDFVPRGRNVSTSDGAFLGDYLDIKLAFGEYRVPLESLSLELYAGKFESVVGREYRVDEAPTRITVAPSLLCRYLCGRPIGVKARTLLLDQRLIINASVTNGSHFWESFGFADEVDSNSRPTGALRVSYAPALSGSKVVEIGASGAVGAQDQQPANDVIQWHAGVDLMAQVGDFEMTAEYVKGKAPGATSAAAIAACDETDCLDYEGAYGLLAYRVSNRLMPYARVDWRDAVHQSGDSFVYISQLVRATAGIRVEIGAKVIFKADYTVNRELGRIPQFANDILATALILRY